MSDGMTGWERMLAQQAAELKKLRGFLADYEARLKAMRSDVALLLATAEAGALLLAAAEADGERSARFREALRVVRARIEWRCYGNATAVEKYPGKLLEYVTGVLDETGEVDGGTSVGRDEADKPNHLNDSGFHG